ncbi:WxL domain-containing protein [Companilactobacillus mishanensis]|uniref:WxL domain-containing protein n=1 Tax=Companilactobacillus mishanensis TaxID=2486008 RepID=UPI00129510A7|nr:WxL domain-containing protein [Companilactobacillus mishanensis]MQS89150.1 hypothetical protein [Companilactobacillus mishanensis]
MKISKTKLAGSLALAGIVLGAVAPTTVQAATSAGSFNEKGEYVAGKVDGLSLNNGDTVVADEVTQASATSEANVQIVSGFLTLDMVPDFSFGTVISGGKTNLKPATVSTIKDDGNSQGILQVSETRDTAKGFVVTAELAGFRADGKGDEQKDFTLALTKQALVDQDGKNIAGASSKQATITSDNKPVEVINLADGAYNKGQIRAIFNNSDAAQLSVGKSSVTGQKKQAYSSVITWKLATQAADTHA